MAADIPKRPRCPSHWTIAQRLDYYIDRSGGPDACWPWTGFIRTDGYGELSWEGKYLRAHRAAWVEANGPIPPDKPHILHKCDNPPCCNHAHLKTGTHKENMADAAAKGRISRTGAPPGERNGRAKLTEADVLTIRGMRGSATVREIAARFGVHRRTVSQILSGNRWKHMA